METRPVHPGLSQRPRGIYSANYNGAYNQGPSANPMAAVATCNSLPATTASSGSYLIGAQWSMSYPWHTSNSAYTHFNTPNKYRASHPAILARRPWGGTSAMITASSNHSGGVNVLMTDGSAKFIKNSINPTTWWAIGTKGGGEVIGADAY